MGYKKNKSMKTRELRIIISGGGTGGHIFPAISIAKAIQQKNGHAEILFVGAHGRMEMEKVPIAGYPIIGLPIMGLQRKLSLKNFVIIPKLLLSIAKCKSIIKAFKPHVVIGVGGYASGPLLYKAQKMNIPTLIQEQNSYAGITNKILAKKAHKICVAYENMERYFPKEKIIMTGNPIRKDLINLNGLQTKAKEHFELNQENKTLLVIGGSLGALTINESIAKNLDELIRRKIQVIWQTGKYYYPKALEVLNSYKNHNVKIHKFINRMDYAYSTADFIISRAGAGSISELCIVGKPVILVPSPNVAEDHQTKNAMALVDKKAAIMVKDSEARQTLIDNFLRLYDSNNLQVELSKNIKKLEKPNADEVIAEEVFKLI